MGIAHEQQLCHLPHPERETHDAVAPIVRRVRQQRHHGIWNTEPERRRVHLLFRQIEIARADVLVGVELDLLESHHARDDVHLAMRRGKRILPRLRKGIDWRHLGVRDCRRVIVAVDLAHERLTALEVEPLHLIQLRLDDVDSPRVERGWPAREIGFANHARLVGGVDDDEIVGGDRSQADGVGRVRLVDPRPHRIRLGVVNESLLRKHAENFLDVVPFGVAQGTPSASRGGAAEGFLRAEWQFERGALDVVHEDVQIVGIDQRAFRRPIEEVRRVSDHELIERRAARHEHRRGPARAPARAPCALPCGGNGAGIPGEDGHVQRADVDAELERVGGDHRANSAFAKTLLDLAASIGQISSAIPANPFRGARRAPEILLQIRRQNLRREPALREYDQL